MKAILFIVTMAIFTSCATQQRCERKFPPVEQSSRGHDSIVTITKDSISYLPADSSWLIALVKCRENGEAYLAELQGYKQGKSINVPVVTIENGRLKATCKIDSIAVYNVIKERYKSNTTATKETVIREVNRLTTAQKLKVNAFPWLLLLIVLEASVIFVIIKFK